MPSTAELSHLIKLMDDDDPFVMAAVDEQLSLLEGDISDELLSLGSSLTEKQLRRISKLTKNARRGYLRDNWAIPSAGVEALNDDLDSFEHLLRVLSDFLHDGVTLRPSLTDELDLAAAELDDTFTQLRAYEYWGMCVEGGIYEEVVEPHYLPVYMDPVFTLTECVGAKTTRLLCFLLVARRLGSDYCILRREGLTIPVFGTPGNYYTCLKNASEGETNLTELSSEALEQLNAEFGLTPSMLLIEHLRELGECYVRIGESQDAQLIRELLVSMGVDWVAEEVCPF